MGVKINSTGGGSVTLDAPSTASNLTVTLPSASGTLTTTSGSTFADITVTGNSYFATSSGNVGVGTSSPSAKFEAYASTAISVGRFSHTGDVANGAVIIGDPNTPSYITSVYLRSTTKANINWSGGGVLAFNGAGDGSSERMRIDSSGNVGIGTSSITLGKLVVSGGNLAIASSAGSGYSFNIYTNGQSNNQVTLAQGFDSTTDNVGYLYNRANAAFVFGTNNTERMRIDSSGNLLVGATSQGSDERLRVVSAGWGVLMSTANRGWLNRQSSSTGGIAAYFEVNNGTNVGAINTTATATSYNTSSDYRLKENIQPMQNALAVVQQLNPVTYTWKADGSDGQGFIAHELQAVVPDCVTGEKDAEDENGNPVYQGVDTSFLVATLTKAIQELKAELDELKAKVN